MAPFSRRDFLRSAGGVTFLALLPLGRGAFAAPETIAGPRLPIFTVLPYIQPGPQSQLKAGADSMVVAWQTQAGPAQFLVEFGETPAFGRSAQISSALRLSGRGGDDRSGTPNSPDSNSVVSICTA
jgi:hypothetical protein